MSSLEADSFGQRDVVVIVNTASIAAFAAQVGQIATPTRRGTPVRAAVVTALTGPGRRRGR